MNTLTKSAAAGVHLTRRLPHQEEDSEEEPKLKYERLSNGVTEILQKDAASCMTVHDKVAVVSQPPQGRSSLKYRPRIVYVHFWDKSSAKLLLSFPFFHPLCVCAASKGSQFFSHLPLHRLSGRHIKRKPIPLSSRLFFPSYSHSCILLRSTRLCFCPLLIFLRWGPPPFSARRLIVVAPARRTCTPEQSTSHHRSRLLTWCFINRHWFSCIHFYLFFLTLRSPASFTFPTFYHIETSVPVWPVLSDPLSLSFASCAV